MRVAQDKDFAIDMQGKNNVILYRNQKGSLQIEFGSSAFKADAEVISSLPQKSNTVENIDKSLIMFKFDKDGTNDRLMTIDSFVDAVNASQKVLYPLTMSEQLNSFFHWLGALIQS